MLLSKLVFLIISFLANAGIFHEYSFASEGVNISYERIFLFGRWNESYIDKMVKRSSSIKDPEKRIEFISSQFLGIGYKESTLIGDINTPEAFVINFEGMDCFTYIDYVEAMRLSNSFITFVENLRHVRYRYGDVKFQNRNHFFTDWAFFNNGFVEDVTKEIGGDKTKKVIKLLNKKGDGSYFLPGLGIRKREIHYIPAGSIDDVLIKKLKTGDYIGIASDRDGLDASHTGIIIKKSGKTLIRHASSINNNGRVVDEDFRTYVSTKPGIIVFRPKY